MAVLALGCEVREGGVVTWGAEGGGGAGQFDGRTNTLAGVERVCVTEEG